MIVARPAQIYLWLAAAALSAPALLVPCSAAPTSAGAASPQRVPLEGITIIRVANPRGGVTVTGVPDGKEAAITWTGTAPANPVKAEVVISRRSNLLDVSVVYPDAKDLPVMEQLELQLSVAVRMNLDLTTGRDVNVSGVEGLVRATSAGGNIDVSDLKGGFDLVTSRLGAIRVGVRRLDLTANNGRTDRGNIDLIIPPAIPISVDAYSRGGTIDSPASGLGMSLGRGQSFSLNGGGLSAVLYSEEGLIRIAVRY